MIAGDRMWLRIASSMMLVLAVFGASGFALGALLDLVMWDLVLAGALLTTGIVFALPPAREVRFAQ